MELVKIRNLKDDVCEGADFNADVLVGKFIDIWGQSGRRASLVEGRFMRKFRIGDMAEYHSYNLSYYGPIVSVTGKSVIIDAGPGEGKKRLTILQFARRNWNFRLDKVEAENADTLARV